MPRKATKKALASRRAAKSATSPQAAGVRGAMADLWSAKAAKAHAKKKK
jgi:hypothetical protein